MPILAVRSVAGAALFIVLCCELRGGAEACGRIETFADGKKPLRERFVSPSGNNNTGQGTVASPFQTISRALQDVRPGDAIRLLPGDYPAGTMLRNLAGTSNAPLWLGGVAGQPRPIIRGGSVALQLSKVRFLIVENIEVSGARANGINADDAGEFANSNATGHLVFRNLFIHDTGTGGNNDGLKLSGVYDYFVLDCGFARMSGGGSGIDQVGCHRGLIARCAFTDARGDGANAVQCKGGSEDLEIRASRFINSGGRAINIGGSTGFEFFRPPLAVNRPNWEAKNIRVIANLFRGSDAPIAFVGTVQSLVANNTIIEPRRWVLRILQETVSRGGYTFLPCGQNRFVNNLVYYDRSRVNIPANVGSNTDPASFEFSHNLWYAVDRPERSQPALPGAESEGLYGLPPRFRNAAGGDFSVTPTSAAAGKGQKLPGVKADISGACYRDRPAIGAFEVTAAAGD